MASIFPDEGLDVILGTFPRGTTTPANLYIGLFTSSNGGSAVPASGAVLAGTIGTGYAECATAGWSTYARQVIASTTSGWGAPGAQTIWTVTGRGVVGAAVS